MAIRQMSAVKSQTGPWSFTRALALAFNEWILMLMLFVYSIFSYVITRFADYSELQPPCLMCSRLDHILERTKHLKKSHWDMICSKHKSEISTLVYCHAHGKLVDVRGMCETCLFSFATTNKSNAETYRLLVGKLGEDSSCFGSKSDRSTTPRNCSCCNQLWMPQAATQVTKPETLPKIRVVGDVRTGKQSTPKKSVRFNHLPHVGYTELKFHSDTESEAVFSEDEGFFREESHKFQDVDLETPRVITLPYDLATDKLINLDFPSQPFVAQNDEQELHFQGIELRTDSLFHECNPVDVVSETSEKVLKEEEIISLDNLFLRSRAMEPSAVVSKEKEDLIHLHDISLTPDESELIPANGLSETSEKMLKKEEIISLDNLLLASHAMEPSAVVSMEKEDLIHFQDISLTPELKEIPANVLLEESKLIPDNVLSETSEKMLNEEEIITSHSMEPSAVVLKETEDLIHLQDDSSIPNFKAIPANDTKEETELICINDITSTSVAAETPEDVLKGIELMSLHDVSLDEVPESLNTNEISVETSKESNTKQDDITSLESEYIFVSSSTSMPEDSTENCVSENKEMKETSLTDSSVSEMALPAVTSHTEAAPDSVSSMSVAAETNLDPGESLMQGDELLDLEDAYNIIVSNEGNKDSKGEAQIEQWMKKDTSRVSEDLKTLLTQISASRGIEFLSPRDISPKVLSDQEIKNLDHDMQLLIQKRMLERNESNLSLEGVSVTELEGESESDRLKRQVDYDRKLLTGLYKELEEERSASAIATNQAMAMITRLQEEKALFQMEALQNLRMMEEQAEYDMEAIQKLNDSLVEKEKLIQDLETEIEYFRNETPQKKKIDVAGNVTEIDSPSQRMSNKIQNCLTGFNEERLYITSCLEKIENREDHVDDSATQESVSELHERVERLKGDLYFLEHVVSSLGHGNEGVQFVKEIASHLQTLRSLSLKRHEHTET